MSVLEAALAYAAHGWPVLPVDGKRPALRDWPVASTTDLDLIHAWWTGRPSLNVGIVTGPRSGLAVVDVDPRSGGTTSLAELEERIGVLPGTVQSSTGGGGVHLVYGHPGHKVTSRAHQLGRGLDVKADGGMIVAPPSVHPETGRAYEWFGGVWDVELTPWPNALVPAAGAPINRPSALRPMPPGGASLRLAGLVQTVMDAVEGDRNSRLFWSACRGAQMIAEGVDRQVIADALLLAAEAVGLSTIESTNTIRSGLHRGQAAA